MLKTLDTLKTDLTALSGTNLSVAALKTFLTNLIDSLTSDIFYSTVTSFTLLKAIVTTTYAAGALIKVYINGIEHTYILTAGTAAADIKRYLIKPDDYTTDNPKYWLKTNCKYIEITDANLNPVHQYIYVHNTGVQYMHVIVMDKNDYTYPVVKTSGIDKVSAYFKSDTEIDLDFYEAIVGTYKILMIF